MKKYFLVIFCATLLFVLTGCGKNQVTCNGTTNEGGVNLKGEVVADFDKENKLTDAVITYEFDDEEKAKQTVKENIDRFSKKKVVLKSDEEGKVYVERVE